MTRRNPVLQALKRASPGGYQCLELIGADRSELVRSHYHMSARSGTDVVEKHERRADYPVAKMSKLPAPRTALRMAVAWSLTRFQSELAIANGIVEAKSHDAQATRVASQHRDAVGRAGDLVIGSGSFAHDPRIPTQTG